MTTTITTTEMLGLMQFMLLTQQTLTVPFLVKRPKLLSDPLPTAVLPEVATMEPRSRSVNKELRANGCTRSFRRAVCTSGILRSTTETPVLRRGPMVGPPLRAKAKGRAERVAEKEKEKGKAVVKTMEKERAMMEKERVKENLKAKVAEAKEKAEEETLTDVKCAVKRGRSTPGSAVVDTRTVKEFALKGQTRTTEPLTT